MSVWLVSVKCWAMSASKFQSKRTKKLPFKVGPKGRFASLAKRRERAKIIFTRLQRILPEPKCELYYETPYQLLISVVLSAQTTDRSVNKCMQPMYEKGLTPEHVARMTPPEFETIIKTIGLAPTKARNVINLTKILLQFHKGNVPNKRADLEALPGVGRKTANVVLAEVFHQPTLAVDTHVFRVGYRLGLHQEPSPQKAEFALLDVIDEKFLPAAHHWLILHGRYTCKALSPACQSCVLNDLCPSANLT